MNTASLKIFILGLLFGVLGSYIFSQIVSEDNLNEGIADTTLVSQGYENNFLPTEAPIKVSNSENVGKDNEVKKHKPASVLTCDTFTRNKNSDINFRFEFDKLQKFFPDQDLKLLGSQSLKETLRNSVLDSSMNNLKRIESLSALKLLDESRLPAELVDQILADLPKFIAENDTPAAVEALILIEGDVQEYQLSQLLDLNQSEDVDIRMATIFAIANADPYRENKHVFEQLYKHDKSKVVRDTAYNILVNEYSQ